MLASKQSKILLLLLMSCIGIFFGGWLLRAGFNLLGSLWVGLFLWQAQRFSTWLIAPSAIPAVVASPIHTRGQRVLLAVITFLGAGVCALGVYLCRLWPEEWQAGLVFVLFGLIVLVPVTIREVQLRKKIDV